jgi:hypothetical protein
MKKSILFIVSVLFSIMLLGQELVPVQAEAKPQDQPQVQAVEQPQAQLQGRDLKKVKFPLAFIHSGKEYPAGNYWLVLAEKDGQSLFIVQNAQRQLLFEELAVVKARSGGGAGSSLRVSKELMKDKEYFRIKVTTPAQWLMGYFLVKQ